MDTSQQALTASHSVCNQIKSMYLKFSIAPTIRRMFAKLLIWHVLLGSQTLGGAFSLHRSTMGQMGVRIALQCNEQDSMMILSDDNVAARLLARPGEAIYNDLDIPNLEKILASGSPFWLAGGFATPAKLVEALAHGAKGVQVGSVFALSNESGFTHENRSNILNSLADPNMRVLTDASASPTGFPFKVIQNNQTLSNDNLYKERMRICDLGYLRTMYQREKGGIGYRCPAEPLDNYEFKNGQVDQAQGSKCLCNALMADIGLGQRRPDGRTEISLLTFGSDLEGPRAMREKYPNGWNAVQAIDFLKEQISQ